MRIEIYNIACAESEDVMPMLFPAEGYGFGHFGLRKRATPPPEWVVDHIPTGRLCHKRQLYFPTRALALRYAEICAAAMDDDACTKHVETAIRLLKTRLAPLEVFLSRFALRNNAA